MIVARLESIRARAKVFNLLENKATKKRPFFKKTRSNDKKKPCYSHTRRGDFFPCWEVKNPLACPASDQTLHVMIKSITMYISTCLDLPLACGSSGTACLVERPAGKMGKRLDALLGRSFKTSKLKTIVKLATSRLAVLKNQRQVRCSHARADVVQLLNLDHQEAALVRVSSCAT